MTAASTEPEPPGHSPRLLQPAARQPTRAARAAGAVRRRLDGSGRASVVLVGVLLAAPALVLRLWGVDSLGFNSDEAVYAGQAASLASDPASVPFFPVFRAHPLLFQALLSVDYRLEGTSALAGRLLSVAFGMGTIWLTYGVGARLYGRRVGVLAALLIGVMPYAVIVNRQVLLDGPMAFCTALALYLLVRFIQTEHEVWLYASAAALGLAVLTKETAILLVTGAYAFFALTRRTRLRLRQAALAILVLVLTVLPYPISLLLAGKSSTGGAFLTWQLLRRANHPEWFYLTTVPTALGIGLVAVAVLGLLWMVRSLSWPEHLLLAWIAGPCLFFQLWAVKGFQYLLPVAVPAAVLAAMVVVSMPLSLARWRPGVVRITTTGIRVVVAAALVASLAVTSWVRIQPAAAGSDFLAGTGGIPGGREAGEWVAHNVPSAAEMLAVGPSMANIIQFYGHRSVRGLSVSPNPVHRNPVYDPVENPDLQIRHGNVQYLVWDSFSAARSPFFAGHLLDFARRYHGQIVHEESITVSTADGDLRKPVITIYEVRP